VRTVPVPVATEDDVTLVYSENLERRRCPYHVDDRVVETDLVEVDLRRWTAMEPSLDLSQGGKSG